MLPSAELGKGNHHNTTDYLKLFTAGYPKLCDFYSMAFFLLVFASVPLCIKNTIAILAPGSNTFAVFVKCIHVRTVFATRPGVINIVPPYYYNYNKFHIS
jgi:hypothetical protein